MLSQDKVRFAQCMAAMGEAFSQEASPFKTEIYFKALSDLSIEDVERATWQVINSRGTATFPKVAEIREAIGGKLEDRAMIALTKVERALREVGAYNSIVFDDPIIHRAICSFDNGWIGVADMTMEEWTWARKDFIRLYNAFSNSGESRSVPTKLLGRIETDNQNRNQNGKFQIVYFGGKDKCLQWQRQQEAQIGASEDKLSKGFLLKITKGIGG